MPDLVYETAGATTEGTIPNEGWATYDFNADEPIGLDVEIPQYPWEETPAFSPEPSVMVLPFTNVLIITSSQRQTEEAARDYVRRIGPSLPEHVREGFTRGAGMFDFAAPPGLDDHLS